jgi:hypothetical protein
LLITPNEDRVISLSALQLFSSSALHLFTSPNGKMFMRVLAAAFLLTLSSTACCLPPPDVAPANPWYKIQPDLLKKAKAHEQETMKLVTSSGLLLYRSWTPWGDKGPERQNALDSHDIADAPAWQGMLMAGLAFAQAVDGEDRSEKLDKLADGLLAFYKISGTKGLLGRSHLSGYKGPRLPWMADKEARPTKYWLQGKDGSWWRNGVAKNHLNMACFGCAVPLALSRKGQIKLQPQTEKKLIAVLVPAVRHLIAGDFRIRDFDGQFTEFGDLRSGVTFGPNSPNLAGLPNPFNRVLVLHMLRSASFYDDEINTIYEEKAKRWPSGVGSTMDILGEVIENVCRSDFDKPSFSDMAAYGLATLSIHLQEDRRFILKPLNRGLKGLWEFMRYERNPCFTLPYFIARPREAIIKDLLEDLHGFPMPDQKIQYQLGKNGKEDTHDVQPLVNRPTNVNYWKSNPYRKLVNRAAKPAAHPKTGARQQYSGQDYLLAYWLGRYLKAFPQR